MIVNMLTIEWNSQGEQVRRDSYRVRAEKPPVMPERFAPIRDGVWQEAHRGEAMLRITTWTVTQA